MGRLRLPFLFLRQAQPRRLGPAGALRHLSMARRAGVVGARLLYPDTLKVQHAGVVLGMSGSAGHVFAEAVAHDEGGYLGRALLDQEYSAVSGACLLIRTNLYREIGGLDATAFKVSYNDIDLCLKVRARGLKVIYTPYATLLHHGSASQNVRPIEAQKAAAFQAEEPGPPLRTTSPAYRRCPPAGIPPGR